MVKYHDVLFNEEKQLINFVLKNRPYIEKFKKHKCVEHCRDFVKYHNLYQKKRKNISGIYKITYLPCRLFTYYGSSNNIGRRIKYHYYHTGKQKNFLGSFIKLFG